MKAFQKILAAVMAMFMLLHVLSLPLFAVDLSEILTEEPECEAIPSTAQAPEGYVPQRSYTEARASRAADAGQTELPRVLLVEDVLPWDSNANQTVLGSITEYDKVTTSQFLQVDLSKYGVIVFANDQPFSSYSNYKAFKEYMEVFASIGGVIVFGACDAGWAGGDLTEMLPGDVSKKTHYVYKNYVVDEVHPIISGSLLDNQALTTDELYSNYCSHVSFNESSFPAGTKVLIRESDTDRPTLIEYPLGKGRVIASGLTWEHNWEYGSRGEYGSFGAIAMKDMFQYAIRVSSIDVEDVHVLEEYFVDKNAHHVIVSDTASQVIKDAAVTIDGVEYKTDENGDAVYTGPYGLKTVSVTAEGYRESLIRYDLQPMGFRLVFLDEDPGDGKPYVTMVSDQDSLFDLRHQTLRFEEKDGTKITLTVTANWNGHGDGQFVIYQDDYQKKITSTDGKFTFAPGKSLAPDKEVKLKLIARDGTESEPIRLNLFVDKEITLGAGQNDQGIPDIKIMEDQSGAIQDKDAVSIFPGEYEMKFPMLPVEMTREIQDDGTAVWKFTIGIYSYSLFEKKHEWINFKRDIQECANKAALTIDTLNDITSRYGGDIWSGTALLEKNVIKPELRVLGFVEIKTDKQGNTIEREGGLIVMGASEATYTRLFMAGPVPFYLEFGAEAKLEFQYGIEYDLVEKRWDFFEPDIGFEVSGRIGGGVGIKGLATIGAEGVAKFDFTFVPTNTLDITLQANLRVELLWLIDWRFPFAKKTFHVWGPEAQAAYSLRRMMQESGDDYTLEIASREYNKQTSEWYGRPMATLSLADHPESVRTLQEYMMPNTLPELVELDGNYIMLFHSDLASRTTGNNVVWMYSTYDNETDTWAEPKPVSLGESSDLYGEIAVVDNELYVVWQKVRNELTATDAEALLSEVASNTDISFAKWNKDTKEFEQVYVNADAALDMYPYLAVDGEKMSLVWVSNSENDAMGRTGVYSFYVSEYRNGAWEKARKVFETEKYVSEIAAGYLQGKLEILYAVGTEVEGGNIYRIADNASELIAEQTSVGEALRFENGGFYWTANGALCRYADTATGLERFQSGGVAAILPSYRMVSNGKTDAVVWLGATQEGDSVLYASMREADGWSTPIAIYEPDYAIRYFDAELADDGSWDLIMSAQADPEAEGVSLVYANVQPVKDTELVLVNMDETRRENGIQPMVFSVANLGQSALDGVTVVVTNEQGDVVYTEVLSHTIGVGEKVRFETNVDLSDLQKKTVLRVEVFADGEWDKSNNYSEVTVGHVDVSLALQQHIVGDNVILSATVTNQSSIPANTAISIMEDSREGIVLDMKNIGVLTTEEGYVYLYSIDRSAIDFGDEDHKYYYVVVDTLEDDWNEFDNYEVIALYPEQEKTGHVHYNADDVYERDENNHWAICDDCNEVYDILAHSESDWLPGKEPTCTEPGHSEWKNCTVCGYVLEAQDVIPEKGHEEQLVNAKEATCTEEGYIGDTVCTVCGAVTRKGETIPMKQHSHTGVNVKKATCTEEGYSGDMVCTVCDAVVATGEIIPVKPHTEITVNAKEPTESEEGYSGDVVCEVCGTVIQKGEIIEPLKKGSVIQRIADLLGITTKQVFIYGGIVLGVILLIVLISVAIPKIRRL